MARGVRRLLAGILLSFLAFPVGAALAAPTETVVYERVYLHVSGMT